MADRRQVLRAMLLGAAGAAAPAVLAGCGVPGGGGAIVDGPGPSPGAGAQISGGSPPPTADHATDAVDLVKKYLLAVAGPLDDQGAQKRQEDAAKGFMTQTLAARWAPPDPTPITVVQLASQPAPSDGIPGTTIAVQLRPIGQLTATGAVIPLGSPDTTVNCKFEVITRNADARGTNAGWRINGITSEDHGRLAASLLLSADALDPNKNLRLFTPQLVYFWSGSTGQVLVPDLRYVPLTGNDQNVQTRIVNDLLLGNPPDWLSVNLMPKGIKLTGPNVTSSKDNELVVAVSATPSPDPHALVVQLRASLDPPYSGPVQLQINAQAQPGAGTGNDFAGYNLASGTGHVRSQAEFCVAGGAVRPMQDTANPPQILSSRHNNGVVSAALSRDTEMIAVVRDVSGRRGLWLGNVRNGSDYVQVRNLPDTTAYSRPAWLPDDDQVLVAAAGKLFVMDSSGTGPTDITPPGLQVSAFSIGPDGRRIALISGGSLFLATLLPSKTAQISQPHQLDTPGLQALSAVAWSRMERVVVAGRFSPTRYSILETTVDRVLTHVYIPDVSLSDPITHLAAYPPPPSNLQTAVMGKVFGQSKFSFEYSGKYSRLPAITPAPSPSPSGSPPKALDVTNPFFAD